MAGVCLSCWHDSKEAHVAGADASWGICREEQREEIGSRLSRASADTGFCCRREGAP